MKEAESAEQFRLLQQAILLAGEAVETLKRDQRAAIDALRLEVEVLKRCFLIIPLCSMPPKFLKLLKRGHENASRGSLANPPLASICA